MKAFLHRLAALLNVQGVAILHVNPGSAAASAGLRSATIYRDGRIMPGDIIVAIEGKAVDSTGKLLVRLDDFKVGATVRLTILRDNKKTDIEVVLQPGI